MTDIVDARRPSRRGADRRMAICDAVFKLLAEVGYDRMTMDCIAERARASKATIYRMWADKPQLVVESVLQRFAPTPEVPDTGSLRGDLMAVMTVACGIVTSADGDVISGLLTAAARTPALAETLQECLFEAKKAVPAAIIGRAIERGEVAVGTDPNLLHEVMHAMILSKRLWSAAPPEPGFVDHVVDDILLPILTCPRS